MSFKEKVQKILEKRKQFIASIVIAMSFTVGFSGLSTSPPDVSAAEDSVTNTQTQQFSDSVSETNH